MRSLAVVVWVLMLAASAYAVPAPYGVDIEPAVKAYTIPGSLAGVRHVAKATDLKQSQRDALAANGFVVIPDRVEQMFFLYEDYGVDDDTGPIPNFITVDSVLQAYHMLFDFALRSAEEEHLVGLCTKLTHLLAGVSVKQATEAPSAALREAASRNLAYFLVARKLLTGQEPAIGASLPGKQDIVQMARDELALIEGHAGRMQSPLTGRTVHYDQFIPRGHYTRSETLTRYFLAMMWYGTVGFELEQPVDEPSLFRRHTLQALLMTQCLGQNEWAAGLWERIYEPTDFIVGGADDLTWQQYVPVARSVYGDDIPLDKLGSEEMLDTFLTEARRALPGPRIAPAFLQVDGQGSYETTLNPPPQGRQFRFMGQRFIPDSYMLQQLVYPKVGSAEGGGSPRYWPKGLDVMAVLGSARAKTILFEHYRENRFDRYADQLAGLASEFGDKPESEWWQNLYWGWLHSLRPLLDEKGSGYPSMMRSDAWLDKELVTCLGSWAQLRHDTILYGKPSGAEMGGAEPKAVEGYVEPYPEVYGRLAYLAHLTRTGLNSRELLTERLSEACEQFEDVLLFLKNCAERQLLNRPVTRDDYWRIQFFGGELERLTLNVATDEEYLRWFEITSEADRHIATIADIHTSFGQCLEVGVGWANRIYVIVPHPGGGLQLAKGGVMSYHEFEWPVSDRLTDEKWLEMLKNDTAPPMPDWTSSFVAP